MKKYLSLLIAITVFTLNTVTVQAASFGNKEDTDYAEQLWNLMKQARMVGDKAVISVPYKGSFPHGDFLDTLDGHLKVGDHDGRLIIKRNYNGEGTTREMIASNPTRHMKAVTVMYKRERGYDTENLDWFWAKYNTGGELLVNAREIPLAGRIAKGSKAGCIACHKRAPGNDMVYINDKQ